MAAVLTDLGEEWTLKNNADGASLTVGLYNDSTDSISDANDIADITTEPSDGNYARQTGVAFSARDVSGDWQMDNDSQVSFDVTSTTGTVDSYFIIANFQADDTGDGASTDHLIVTGALSQSYDLSNIDTLNINANTMGFSLT
jgi:hypothetical protein